MPWAPNPNEPSGQFEGPVLLNCLSLIERDFKEALDYNYLDSPTYLTRYGVSNQVGPTGWDLKDFKERTLGPPLRNLFPRVAVEPRSSTVEGAEDGSHNLEVVRFRVYIAVTDDGPRAVTEKLFKYVRVMHLVIYNARRDLVEGLSNPFGFVLTGFEHIYDLVRSEDSIIGRVAVVDVSVGIRER